MTGLASDFQYGFLGHKKAESKMRKFIHSRPKGQGFLLFSCKNILFYLGLLIYLMGTVFWAISLKYNYLSKAVSVFTVLNLIIVVLVGVVYFKENLSFTNKAGVLLGILSVILIEI